MGIGTKIKEYRNKIGYTQKDLADELHVTYQAVSRWENDDVEPSIDTLKEMARLFNCSIDDLFGIEKEQTTEPAAVVVAETKEPEPVEDKRAVIGVCQDCSKQIKDLTDIKHVTEHKGRGGSITYDLCKSCYNKREVAKNKAKQLQAQEDKKTFKIRRIHSFIWPSIVAAILLVFAIIQFVNGDSQTGAILIGSSVLSFTFISCWILWNNFVPDLWMEIASWSLKLPGIIFTLDFDGLIFLIGVKILFAILGFLASLLAFIFATVVGMAASIFVYPYAIIKNIHSSDATLDLN